MTKRLGASEQHNDDTGPAGFEQSSVMINNEQYKKLKCKVIDVMLKTKDVVTLSMLGGTNLGFVDATHRRLSWSLLLSKQFKRDAAHETIAEHPDENQVKLDCARSFGTVADENWRTRLQMFQETLICRLLRRNHKLRYYQGYHDIVSIFVNVFVDRENIDSNDHNTLLACLEAFTLLYLRDFMMDSLHFAIDQIRLIPSIVKLQDKGLVDTLKLDNLEPFYAISSILTVFSHNFKPKELDNSLIFSIFDFVISSQSMLVPLVMYSKFILKNKDRLLKETNHNSENFLNNTDLIHAVLQRCLSISNEGPDPQWTSILNETRVDYKSGRFLLPKLASLVNEYSPLITTASHSCFNSGPRVRYYTETVNGLLDKAIELNGVRKHLETTADVDKLYRQHSVLFKLFPKVNDMPLAVKASLVLLVVSLIYQLQE
ncbi:GTPase-activating protein GYP8 KNAG_0E03280 [Huiozyma naganishii CBS 8797]|uniref:Rab-GAP TBC domain-containing protein n=1 Tax=Huiozyma naganishii (strain ATCC MYA-139 / BCRC 22969 / CBS 8797 / KCTC 17520 / NBRC 10181 / NCYC 3082 / Yp74L-3) TaxID=1071383 RepID=J7RZF5_HUIN7|nr:hypothetical protein KNAG_0E03280 [Kazachstania naganishii CBS 8797]CCK70587.1 hypothetical protein KNAG_0E03280 [Kazachstania naganishii CBS 8797]